MLLISSKKAGIRVREAGPNDGRLWNGFVSSMPHGTVFHLFEWYRIIRDTFRHDPIYLVAENDTGVVGVLPLFFKKSVLFGDAIISTPFCTYGGVLTHNQEASDLLMSEAVRIGVELRVDFLELRCSEPVLPNQNRYPNYTDVETYATFVRELSSGSPSEIIRSVPSASRRQRIRQSLKRNLTYVSDASLDDFYDVISESYRDLGTPIFPRRYFQAILNSLRSVSGIGVVYHEGRPIAGSLFFLFGDSIHPYYSGGVRLAKEIQANDFLYLSLMMDGYERRLGTYDFGRSRTGTGTFEYKKYWGFSPRPLHYMYTLIGARSVPNVSPGNKKYQLPIRIWRRLPLWLTRFVGPLIVREIG